MAKAKGDPDALIWDYIGGEPWIENPRLGIVNGPERPKRRSSKVKRARNKKGQFKKGGGRKPARRNCPSPAKRAPARRNPWAGGGAMINKPRRRAAAKPKPRRKARRNPPRIFGLTMPSVNQVLFTGVGFIGTPMAEGMLGQLGPLANLQNTTAGKYAVRVGTVLVLSLATRQFIGTAESRSVMLGGAIYVMSTAAADAGWLPGVPGRDLEAYVPQANQVPRLAPPPGQLRKYVRSTSTAFQPFGDGRNDPGITAGPAPYTGNG